MAFYSFCFSVRFLFSFMLPNFPKYFRMNWAFFDIVFSDEKVTNIGYVHAYCGNSTSKREKSFHNLAKSSHASYKITKYTIAIIRGLCGVLSLLNGRYRRNFRSC